MNTDSLRTHAVNVAHATASVVATLTMILGLVTAFLNAHPNAGVPESVSWGLIAVGGVIATVAKIVDVVLVSLGQTPTVPTVVTVNTSTANPAPASVREVPPVTG